MLIESRPHKPDNRTYRELTPEELAVPDFDKQYAELEKAVDTGGATFDLIDKLS